MEDFQGLRGVRVLDVSTGIPGAYLTKLFADAGADVVKVEPPGGDPLRSWRIGGGDVGPDGGALFAYLHGGKRSVVGRLGEAPVEALLTAADVLVSSDGVGVLDVATLRARYPGLVVVTITAYGYDHPFTRSGHPWTEFTLQAETGCIGVRGYRDHLPVQIGGRLCEWLGGVFAAPAALAAVLGARRHGHGEHVDVSIAQCIALATNLFSDTLYQMLGVVPSGPARTAEVPCVEPTADGVVGFQCNTRQQFDDFLLLIERPDLLGDEELAVMPVRQGPRRAEFNEAVRAWTTRHTTAEIIELASELRVPAAPVHDGRTILDDEHLRLRGALAPSADGRFVQPTPPYRIDGRRVSGPRPAPRLGEHTGAVDWPVRPEASLSVRERVLPFEGLRVVDLTNWWAGPSSTYVFACLGADVIHVESVQRIDGQRTVIAPQFRDRDWWEYGSFFLSYNANKRDLTVDLNRPEGVDVMKRLIATADLVVENFAPRVVERFGLGWDTVHEVNPRAVMVRMPGYGLDGPARDRVGFAQNVEQYTGVAWLTGHVDQPPTVPRGPGDPIGGFHAAFAAMVALVERDRTGVGSLVEVPLVEASLNVNAESLIEWSAYGTLLSRIGNRSRAAAPQGLYACAGTERWLALSCATDDHWHALVEALGRPSWALDARFATAAGRWEAADELDAALGEWAAARELDEAVAVLLGHGVPAAAMTDPRRIHDHPAVSAMWERYEHPVVGTYAHPTLPFRFASVARWTRTPAPTLGQHNHEVLNELGLDDGAVAAFEASHLIGTRPLRL